MRLSKEDMNNNYLIHHGILGQKWGIRRYQNSDGTLTSAGQKRYGSSDHKNRNRRAYEATSKDAEDLRRSGYTKEADAVQKVADKQLAKALKKEQKQASKPKSKKEQKYTDKVNQAAERAKRNMKYAKEDIERYRNMKSGKGVTSSDIKRWTRVSEKNYQRAKDEYDKYSKYSTSGYDKNKMKEAEKYINAMYEEAEYTDYYDKGKWKNYND